MVRICYRSWILSAHVHRDDLGGEESGDEEEDEQDQAEYEYRL